jgi:Cofilin/tropomyosin-type actin-binding protein
MSLIQNKSHCGIKGISDLEKHILHIKTHKIKYLVFAFKNLGNGKQPSQSELEIEILYKGGQDTSSDPTITLPEETLKSTFKECIGILEPDKPCFIVYDFGYYNETGNYRDMIVLISYIPDSVHFKQKVPYSSNAVYLQTAFDISRHHAVHDKDDLTYDILMKDCSNIQRK